MKKAAIGIMTLILAGVVAMAAASVTGTWEMAYTTQRGDMKQDVTFTQTGENLAVSMMMPQRQGDPVEVKGTGTIKGSDIVFKITRTTQRGEMTTEYKAKLVDDNTMTGTFERNMGGNATTIEWKAVRKPK